MTRECYEPTAHPLRELVSARLGLKSRGAGTYSGLPGSGFRLGPKGHVNMRIFHSGSKAQYQEDTRDHGL